MKNWTIDSSESQIFVLLDINNQTVKRKFLNWRYFYDMMVPVFETNETESVKIDGFGNIYLI